MFWTTKASKFPKRNMDTPKTIPKKVFVEEVLTKVSDEFFWKTDRNSKLNDMEVTLDLIIQHNRKHGGKLPLTGDMIEFENGRSYILQTYDCHQMRHLMAVIYFCMGGAGGTSSIDRQDQINEIKRLHKLILKKLENEQKK